MSITGGNITVDGSYTIHSFTIVGSDTFSVDQTITCDILIVAGGGSGGGSEGGGGGAGGVVFLSGSTVNAGDYTVIVGDGGSGSTAVGNNGNDSSYDATSATGGGGGGSNNGDGYAGGGGSGGGASNGVGTGGYGVGGQGSNGGASGSWGGSYETGGGGGAGGVGQDGNSGYGGGIGVGVEYSGFAGVAGSPSGWFAGGGAGVEYYSGGGTGGQGGGGSGSAGSGTSNTGGGGAGQSGNSGDPSGAGGSGIVLIRYLTPPPTASETSSFSSESTSSSTSAHVYWLDSWAKRIPITIPNTSISETLTNFPVLIKLSASAGLNTKDLTQIFTDLGSNSLKIAVTTHDGQTQCYTEIEKWDNDNSVAWLWCKIPNIDVSIGENLYLYFDNSQADNTTYIGLTGSTTAQNVWDSNYVGVWHLDEDNDGTAAGASIYIDATSNALTGNDYNTTTNKDGELYQGQKFGDNASDRIVIPETSKLNLTAHTGGLTIEAWCYFNGGGSNAGIFTHKQNGGGYGGYMLTHNSSELWVHDGYLWIEGPSVSSSVWLYCGYRANLGETNDSEFFVNGSFSNTFTHSTSPDSGDTYIGNYFDANNSIDGSLDEVRISKSKRSQGWLLATYNSSKDQFSNYGDIETLNLGSTSSSLSSDSSPSSDSTESSQSTDSSESSSISSDSTSSSKSSASSPSSNSSSNSSSSSSSHGYSLSSVSSQSSISSASSFSSNSSSSSSSSNSSSSSSSNSSSSNSSSSSSSHGYSLSSVSSNSSSSSLSSDSSLSTSSDSSSVSSSSSSSSTQNIPYIYKFVGYVLLNVNNIEQLYMPIYTQIKE